jgi:hypothetical protein
MMCDPGAQQAATHRGQQAPRVEPQIRLARLMERELWLSANLLDPVALRLFILAHWSKVSALAHQIHDESVRDNG